jgi:hypothetical protein
MENSIIKYYDYTSIFNNKVCEGFMSDIDTLISNGGYFKGSYPQYQTRLDIFEIFQDPKWSLLKKTFLDSCKDFYGKDFQIKKLKSWSYKKNDQTDLMSRDLQWHQHEGVVNGIFYLNISENECLETYGTEFAPNALRIEDCPNDNEKFYSEAKIGNWIVWNSSVWHRPGITKSNNWRYVIVADLEIEIDKQT